MDNFKILIVEDETDLADIISFNLENEGYVVDVVGSAELALEKDLTSYHLFLFDVMLEEMSGIELAKKVQQNTKTESIPIVFITAKDTEIDKLIGFKAGADDYITKPFSVKVMSARIGAVLKRVYKGKDNGGESELLEFDKLTLNVKSKRVMFDKKEIVFTKKEFDLLCLLMRNEGIVYSRSQILDLVWQEDVYVVDRTVDVNIRRIRKKLDEYGKYIKTRSGYGYMFLTTEDFTK